MPKSSSFTVPSVATSTFDGLMSRCTIRLACACATAASTSRNSSQTRVHVKPPAVTIVVDAFTLDELQDQVRLAGRRDAGVDQPRDVRVREPREDIAFAPEALLRRPARSARRSGT